MRITALVISLLTACQLSADLVSTNSRAASEAWVSRRFASTQDLAAVTGQLGPRIAALEGGTNAWNTAYAWGNHAGAGYLLSSAWNTWLSTNTYVKTELDQTALAALAAFAATNNLTRWQDASEPSMWWEARGGTNLTAYETEMLNTWVIWSNAFPSIKHEMTGLPDAPVTEDPPTLLNWNTVSGAFYGSIFASFGTYNWNVESIDDGGNGDSLGVVLASVTISYMPYEVVTNVVASYNLVTGNVWQAVIEAKADADAAQFAADQASTLVNYHAAIDPAPHAGKFVTPLQLTNALAGAGSIIQPLRLAATNIVISATNAVYVLSLTNAANIGVDVSGLALGGTNCAAATLLIDCLNTQALASAFNTNSVAFDMPWEPTVTGCYEVAVRSDGVRTTARQAWPKTDSPMYGYTKLNYAGSLITTPDLVAIASGVTNGAAHTFVACHDCYYAVRAQFTGGNEGDLITIGYYRNVYGYIEHIGAAVIRTAINPAAPFGFTTGWVVVPPTTIALMRTPGFVNTCGVWITRSSSTGDLVCRSIEVRKANALEIKAAQAMGL